MLTRLLIGISEDFDLFLRILNILRILRALGLPELLWRAGWGLFRIRILPSTFRPELPLFVCGIRRLLLNLFVILSIWSISRKPTRLSICSSHSSPSPLIQNSGLAKLLVSKRSGFSKYGRSRLCCFSMGWWPQGEKTSSWKREFQMLSSPAFPLILFASVSCYWKTCNWRFQLQYYG